MSLTTNELLHFIQGSDITGESSYDIWKNLNPDGTPEQYLDFIGAEATVNSHNSSTDSHADIRQLIANLQISVDNVNNNIGEAVSELSQI